MCIAPLPQAKLERRKHRMSESQGEVGWDGKGRESGSMRKRLSKTQMCKAHFEDTARSKRYVSAASFGERVVERDRSWIVKEFSTKRYGSLPFEAYSLR